MKTVICIDITGPFNEIGTIKPYTSRRVNVYIEFPDSLDDLESNRIKVTKYMNDKRLMITDINKTVENEQPVCQGLFTISSIMITDENITKVIDSNFIGYNVINRNNKLEHYVNKNADVPSNKSNKDPSFQFDDLFITMDGIGFNCF